ncbi:hypothetical protein UG54_01410 [Gordonia sihwensis]|nr:hypothetical protein UG54_01410 [Gordonia sihwensis]
MSECPECKLGEMMPLYRFTGDCGHDDGEHTTDVDTETCAAICLDSPVGESRCDLCGEHVSDGGAA